VPDALTLRALTLRFLRNFRKFTAKNTTGLSVKQPPLLISRTAARIEIFHKRLLDVTAA